LVAAFAGWLCASLFFTAQHPWLLVLWSALLAIVAQAGDFLESAIKRYFHVKDSGTLIPGHGGLLDRIDGYTFVSPTVLIMVLMTPGGLFV
jgi:phosphatidate cytidylyltransferase